MNPFSGRLKKCLLLLGAIACGALPGLSANLQTYYPANVPLSGLVLAPDGNLYGTSYYGGASDAGTVFRLSTSGNYQVIYTFTGAIQGSHPVATLTLGPDGQLYGSCEFGGIQNAGTLFKITTDGSFTLLHLLDGSVEGSGPVGGLVLGANGSLFGTTSGGGPSGAGSIFQMTTSGSFAVLHAFTGNDGSSPAASLTSVPGSLLLGTTRYGGSSGDGTIFKISEAGSFTSLFSFHGNDGFAPDAPLALGTDGALYGTTAYGGSSNFGSVFKITTGGAFTSILGLSASQTPAGIAFGSDGNLYGTAVHGGIYGFGTIYRLSTGGIFSVLHDFTGTTDGGYPQAALASGREGNFFGTTLLDTGTFFELTTAPYFKRVESLPGGQLIRFTGVGGAAGGQFTILTSTNAGAALATWGAYGINSFDAAGQFSFIIPASSLQPRRFVALYEP